MKSLILSALLVGSACAQSLAGLPTCAYSCVANSIPVSCNLDPKCICSATSFIAGVTCCVEKVCSVADQEATLKYAKGICTPAGVTLTQTAAVCASSSAAESSAAESSTMKSTATSMSATSSLDSSALTSTSSVHSYMSSSLSSAMLSTSSVASSASSPAVGPATSAAGAGQLLVNRGGDIFAAVVAAAALL